MRVSRFQNAILTDLFKNRDGLLEFTLYNRYKRPLKELITSINELVAQELVREVDERILLTQKGVDFITSQGVLSIPSSTKVATKENVYGPSLGINDFYVPKVYAAIEGMCIDNEEE